MRKRQVVAIVLVVLIVTSGIALAKARGKPVLSIYAPDNEFAPGDDATLELFIQNAGEVAYATSAADEARVTTARDVVVTVEADDAPIEVETRTRPAGNVPEGVSDAIPFAISVDENATPGEYDLPVTVEYKHTSVIGSGDGAQNEREEVIHRTVTVVIENAPKFRIVGTDAPDLFAPTGPVTLTIENVGSATAGDANVAITSGSGQLTFGDADTAETFVGRWAPGETRDVTVEATLATGADRRSYPLTATVTYENQDGESETSEALTTGVTPRIGSRFAVEDVESTLVVGEEGTISGRLVNNGGSTARSAVIVLSANTRNLEPVETEYALGDVEGGDSATFSFDAEVSESASGGPRQLSFTVQYRDRFNDQRESDPLDATVDVGPTRDVFEVSPVDATLQAGGSGQLRLDVTNNGDEPVTAVSAKLFANSPLSTSDDEAFIDRLEPGDTEQIVFSVSAGGSALAKDYPVSVDFQYDDADGDTLLSDTYQVPVTVSVPEDEGGLPILPIVGVLVVLGGAGLVVYWRRRTE